VKITGITFDMDIYTVGNRPASGKRKPPRIVDTKVARRRGGVRIRKFIIGDWNRPSWAPRSLHRVRLTDLRNIMFVRPVFFGQPAMADDELAVLKVAAPHLRAEGGEGAVQDWIATECRRAVAELGLDRVQAVAAQSHRFMSAEEAGREIGLAYEERQEARAWSIRFCGQSDEDLKEAKRERDREAAARQRRAAGVRPRAESMSRLKPWLALGKSESWFRRKPRAEQERLAAEIRGPQVSNTGAHEFMHSPQRAQPAPEPAVQRAVGCAPEGAPATPIPAERLDVGRTGLPGPKPEQTRPAVIALAPDQPPSWQALFEDSPAPIRMLSAVIAARALATGEAQHAVR
jgi:hypothetical protein